MTTNPNTWIVFLVSRDLDRVSGDQKLEAAGYKSRQSHHASQDEARSEAENRIRTLLASDPTVEWGAFYAEPWTNIASSLDNAPRVIRSCDLRADS